MLLGLESAYLNEIFEKVWKNTPLLGMYVSAPT